jgi:4-amino-4-deoxy-L-arabinose transferase-like glycosyltransferase
LREQLKGLLRSTGFIVLVAFVVRMAFVYYDFVHLRETAVRDNLQFGGELGSVAASIASGHGFSSPMRMVPTGPTALFAPIYPYLIAGIFKFSGIFSPASALIIHTMECAFSAFTCWPIYAIGKKAFGTRTAVAAAWVWVLFPTAIYFSVEWVWDTSLAALWMALLVAATLELRGSDKLRSWVGYGALWTIGTLINPSLLSVLPFLGVWAIWPLRQRLATAAKLSAACAVIFVVGISPWTIRNYVVFHRFIPLRSNFGLELWLGNHSELPGRSVHPVDYQPELDEYVRLTEIPYMQEKEAQAFAFIRTHPADAANFTLHRFADTWLQVSDSPADLWRTAPLFLRTFIVANCLFSLLSLLGALFAYRSQSESALPLATVLLVFPFVFYFTHTALRYRFLMEPIMEILTVFAIAYPLSRLAQHWPAISHRVVTDQSYN